MYRMAEETAEALKQTDRHQQERPSREVLDLFVAQVEDDLQTGRSDSQAIADALNLAYEHSIAMVDGLEALSLSEVVPVQIMSVDLNHQALEIEVGLGDMPHEQLDRIRNCLVDLMNSSNDVVRDYAVAAFEERRPQMAEHDKTSLGWLEQHATRREPRQVHGASYDIRVKQLAALAAAGSV